MGVQSRRRQAMKRRDTPTPVPLTPEEQRTRYHEKWVQGHPKPVYKQTNLGGHQGPKDTAPRKAPKFQHAAGTPFIALPLVDPVVMRTAGWFHGLRKKSKTARTARVRAGRTK